MAGAGEPGCVAIGDGAIRDDAIRGGAASDDSERRSMEAGRSPMNGRREENEAFMDRR